MQKLVLLHPLDGDSEFIVGHNCKAITALGHGGYAIERGSERIEVTAARVERYVQSLPGLTTEPKAERNGLSPVPERLPKGIRTTMDGYGCADCKYTSGTLHGVKVHRGMEHPAG